MPTYVYEDSEHRWEVFKPISQFDTSEVCPTCGKDGTKVIVAPYIDRSAAGDWNTQTFHPALGCYTASNKHARQIAKSRGMEEVGNEKPDNVHKHFEQQREDTKKRRWDDALREKTYE